MPGRNTTPNRPSAITQPHRPSPSMQTRTTVIGLVPSFLRISGDLLVTTAIFYRLYIGFVSAELFPLQIPSSRHSKATEPHSPHREFSPVGSAARVGDTDLAWLGRMFFWVSHAPESSVMTSFVSPVGETLVWHLLKGCPQAGR